ncbi:hypothetical protein [Leucobacter japonicus]|uniref:hypothetical protein n=1 Tax=Leucobacter japonicus TaxID=1461259 RepID=UPI0006A7A0B4|nr:hypothetical protein [Leucobacter japonicus]
MPSLIQQRLAFEREHRYGWWMLVLAVLAGAFAIHRAALGPAWLWIGVLIWVALALLSLRRILRARRARRAFELEHGPDAGIRP